MSLHVSLRGLWATSAVAQNDGWTCLVSDSRRHVKISRVPSGPMSPSTVSSRRGTGPVPEQDSQALPFQKAPKYQNQLILGVMAVDVSLEDIKRLTPHFTVRVQTQTVHRSRVKFTLARCSAAVWTKRLLLRHGPQRIRAAAPQPPAEGKARRADLGRRYPRMPPELHL